ncbi:MAG: putative quinol monooxygenase [Paracoccus hibiscisoli]|uniref:putative quinol monooxygenase n=1 Tax=Paracoccus hibiscisoli TaxID=2023261 RepID=UPI00391CC0E0
MDCACGHHHAPTADPSGTPLAMANPPIALHGRLICADMAQLMIALELLPDHVAASRAEPRCLRFDIAQSDDPMVWTLSEVFADAAAFAAHQARTAASPWGQRSQALTRDFHRHEAQPRIRPATQADAASLSTLLTAGTPALPALIAHVEGVAVAHLSPSGVATIHPALQDRGIVEALQDHAAP